MFGVKKLLVGVDLVSPVERPDQYELPEPTRRAVDLALQVGEFSSAQLTFFSVADPTADNLSSPEAAERAAMQSILDSLVNEAKSRKIRAQSSLTTGRGWLEITREVLRNGHQMVVVGSRRNPAASRLWLGSTGIKLLRKCPCPVWVVRPESAAEVKTVIIADDLKDIGRHCLHLSVSAARLLDARLLVLHAVQYPLERQMRRVDTSTETMDEYRDSCCKAAERDVYDRLAATDYRTISEGTKVEITSGRPELVIHDAIDEHGAELLVMGTIARGGIPGLLVGNTAERLLGSVRCSIIAVKPDGFVSPVPLD